MNHDDIALVRRFREGDEGAFTELVNRYKGKAFGIAYRFLDDVEDAKDASLEAFVKVYRSINNFKEGSSFFTWFYRILVNHCIDFKRKKRLFNRIGLESDIEDKKDPTPLEGLMARELGGRIEEAIDSLPDGQRVVFILRNYEGLSLAQIAEVTGCAVGTVKSHLARAVAALRDKLTGGDSDGRM